MSEYGKRGMADISQPQVPPNEQKDKKNIFIPFQ